MQLHYFIFVGLFIEGNAGGYSPGRMDQNLYPDDKRDVEAGILTDARRRWNSSNACGSSSANRFWDWNEPAATHYAGFCAFQNVCIGGVDMDGLDAVNPLSYLMLQATIDTQMVRRVPFRAPEPQEARGLLPQDCGTRPRRVRASPPSTVMISA